MQKPSLSILKTLFDADSWPEFVSIESPSVESDLASLITFHIMVQPELSYFTGHFPGQAVLPGVVQVHWAAMLSILCVSADTTLCPVLKSTVLLNKVKFNNPVIPGYELSLELVHKPEKRQFAFRYFDSQLAFSSGLITLAGQPTVQQLLSENSVSATDKK